MRCGRRRSEISSRHANKIIVSLIESPVDWADDEEAIPGALSIARHIGHPDYGCIYLALDLRIGAMVVTADTRFANNVGSIRHEGAVLMVGSSLSDESSPGLGFVQSSGIG